MAEDIKAKKPSILNGDFIYIHLILVAVVFLGFYVRIVKLNDLSVSFVEPLHIYAAKSILDNGKPTLPSGVDNSRALLFTQSVALSFKFLGISEFAARIPSVIFGTLTIILIFFIGKDLFGTAVGLVAAVLTAFIPFEVVWSRECRMYAMFQFFSLLGFWAFYKGFEDDEGEEETPKSLHRFYGRFRLSRLLSYWKLSLGWLVISAVLFYVSFTLQPTAAAFYVSLLIYVLIMFIILIVAHGFYEALGSKYFISLIILTLIGVIGFLFMGRYMISDVYGFSPEWAANRDLLSTFVSFFTSKSLFLVTAFFILGSIQICTRLNKRGFYTLVTAAVPILLILPTSVPLPRYVYHVFPLILLISSFFICNLFEVEREKLQVRLKESEYNLSPKVVTFAVSVLFGLCLLSLPVWYINVSNLPNEPTGPGGEHHANWKDACSYLNANYKDGDVIVTTLPLAALYHCGKAGYSLDNGHKVDNLQLPRKESGMETDFYSGAEVITNMEELNTVITQNRRGLMLLDLNRFDNPNHVPENINSFINQHFSKEYTTKDGTVIIFRWGRDFSNDDK